MIIYTVKEKYLYQYFILICPYSPWKCFFKSISTNIIQCYFMTTCSYCCRYDERTLTDNIFFEHHFFPAQKIYFIFDAMAKHRNVIILNISNKNILQSTASDSTKCTIYISINLFVECSVNHSSKCRLFPTVQSCRYRTCY